MCTGRPTTLCADKQLHLACLKGCCSSRAGQGSGHGHVHRRSPVRTHSRFWQPNDSTSIAAEHGFQTSHAPAIGRHIVRDDGAVAAALGDDGLGRVISRVHIGIGQVSHQHIAPAEPRVAWRGNITPCHHQHCCKPLAPQARPCGGPGYLQAQGRHHTNPRHLDFTHEPQGAGDYPNNCASHMRSCQCLEPVRQHRLSNAMQPRRTQRRAGQPLHSAMHPCRQTPASVLAGQPCFSMLSASF